MARSFVASGAVANESGKFHDGQVGNVGILYKGANIATATEGAAGCAAGENLGGLGDTESTNGAEAVTTKEDQREPPTRSSATQSARAEITRNAPIKSARAVRKGFRGFMGF